MMLTRNNAISKGWTATYLVLLVITYDVVSIVEVILKILAAASVIPMVGMAGVIFQSAVFQDIIEKLAATSFMSTVKKILV